MANEIGLDTQTALKQFNHDYSKQWTFGENWTNVNKDFETFINKYLFPKINETILIQQSLGNRFDSLAKEVDFIGQYSEEYVIMDTLPVNMNLSKNAELMFKRNYPRMATKLYLQPILRKIKFTLNNNDVRLNFSTLGDATTYAMGVYVKALSDINVAEEREIKAMLVDYALNQTKEKRTVASREELFTAVFEGVLNIQNNSERYNEADKASGGALGRYTTVSSLDKVAILTTDAMKTYLLDTKLANTYQVNGLDLSDRIISFDTLGGVFKVTKDVTVASEDTIKAFRQMGDYQIAVGDVIPKDSVFTFDISKITELAESTVELKPNNDLFAYVFDIDKIRYRRNTKGMMKEPFYNGELDEWQYWLHYASFKSVSPFFNSILVTGE